jgi:hypothetical protein
MSDDSHSDEKLAPIEKQLLAHTIPKQPRRKLFLAGAAVLLLIPLGWFVFQYFAARQTLGEEHEVELEALAADKSATACHEAQVHLRWPGETSAGWQRATLPSKSMQVVGGGTTARLSVTAVGDCTVECRVRVDGVDKLSCVGSHVSCEYPPPLASDVARGCRAIGQ